jgi:DNA-binding transcriptional LysR family regulator
MDVVYGMRVLLAVVDAGSFAAAAEALDTSTAAVSRQVAALEAHLGTRLMNRTTRRLSLTEAGADFAERSRTILVDLAEAESLAGLHSVEPVGLLRVTAPLSFGITHFSRLLPGFLRRHPKLKLDLDLSDRVVDLVNERVDVALRIAREPSPTLVARRLASVGMVVCASPAYLKRHGTPRTPGELVDHRTLSFSYLWAGDDWTFEDAQGHLTTVRVNADVHATNGDVLRELAVAGEGIVLQPNFLVGMDVASGALVPLLTEWKTFELSLYAVYLSRRNLSLKVRAFVDYLVESIGPTPYWEHRPAPQAKSLSGGHPGASGQRQPRARSR